MFLSDWDVIEGDCMGVGFYLVLVYIEIYIGVFWVDGGG